MSKQKFTIPQTYFGSINKESKMHRFRELESVPCTLHQNHFFVLFCFGKRWDLILESYLLWWINNYQNILLEMRGRSSTILIILIHVSVLKWNYQLKECTFSIIRILLGHYWIQTPKKVSISNFPLSFQKIRLSIRALKSTGILFEDKKF